MCKSHIHPHCVYIYMSSESLNEGIPANRENTDEAIVMHHFFIKSPMQAHPISLSYD